VGISSSSSDSLGSSQTILSLRGFDSASSAQQQAEYERCEYDFCHFVFEIQDCSINPPPTQQCHVNGVDLFTLKKSIVVAHAAFWQGHVASCYAFCQSFFNPLNPNFSQGNWSSPAVGFSIT
jgi:hypothetical protein